MLTKELKQFIKEHSLSDKTKESIGFLVYKADEIIPVKAKNISEQPDKHCVVCPTDYLKAKLFGDIIGLYHSHLEKDTFSALDKQTAQNHNLKLVMYSIKSNQFFEYNTNEKYEYTGRKFQIGKEDCFTLFRDYYKNKLNITITDYPRNKNWIKHTPDIFEKTYKKEGFIKIEKIEDLQKNDGILLYDGITSYATHIMVYLGDNQVLHHPRRQPSLIENFSNELKARFAFGVRYYHG